MKNSLVSILFFLLAIQQSFSQVVINEIMQSNVDCLFVDNEYPNSWVELYNNSDAQVIMEGCRIGSKDKFSKAYKLPTFTMEPYSYRLIYCDKEAKGFHTDFSLEMNKGKVYLFNGKGVIMDAIEYKNTLSALPINVSYGKYNGKWGYMSMPTPGGQNAVVYPKILPAPIFSKSGRVYAAGVSSDTISITLPQDAPSGTKIIYTLDGSEPDENSFASSRVQLLMDATTVVRAKLLCEGYISPVSTTHSYIFHTRETALPIFSVVTDSAYLYDAKSGILVEPNYKQDWRRPLNIEYFEGRDKDAIINQLCEARVQGGATRIFDQKSMAYYAKGRYGNNTFDYAFWKDKPDVQKSKSFILRNAGNDCLRTHIRDAFVQRLFALNLDNIDWQSYEPSICYINGVYKGIYNIRERSNDDYVFSNYDELEDIDMIENWQELKAGDWDSYNNLRTIIADSLSTLEDVQAVVDVDNLLKLLVLEVWSENEDFPGNNIVMWRDKSVDGKWRWILKDIDFVGLIKSDDSYDDNYFDFLYRRNDHSNDKIMQNSDYATELFRFLLSKKPFEELFINTLAVYMGGFLNPKHTVPMFEQMSSRFASEYPYHLEAYNNFSSFNITMPLYKTYYGDMLYWLNVRHNYLYRHIAESFNLSAPVPLVINCSDVDVNFNGIPLMNNEYDGQYFADKDITLECLSEDYIWKIVYWIGDSCTTQVVDTPMMKFQLPQECSLVEAEVERKEYDPTRLDIRLECLPGAIKIQCRSHLISAVDIYSAAGSLVCSEEAIHSNSCEIKRAMSGTYILKISLSDGYVVNKKVFVKN